jgi:hypothetical protein
MWLSGSHGLAMLHYVLYILLCSSDCQALSTNPAASLPATGKALSEPIASLVKEQRCGHLDSVPGSTVDRWHWPLYAQEVWQLAIGSDTTPTVQ